MNKHVLITRPTDDAHELATEIAALGYEPVIEPMLQIIPRAFDVPDQFDGLIFTSANAVRIVSAAMDFRGARVFCVGERTAECAATLGWRDIVTADGNVDSLCRMLEGETSVKKLIYFSGEDVTRDIISDYLLIDRINVYKAEQAEAFSSYCFDLLMGHKLAAVLFFSVRTAEAFSALVRKYGCAGSFTSTKALCLADSMVKSVEYLPWQEIHIASTSERTALLKLLDDIKED